MMAAIATQGGTGNQLSRQECLGGQRDLGLTSMWVEERDKQRSLSAWRYQVTRL